MNSTEERVKHLEMVQVVINRLAGNTFLIKGWTVTFVAALLALAVEQTSWAVAALAGVGAVAFGMMDAYYLRLERMFRCLYADVDSGAIGSVPGDHSFTMDTRHYSRRGNCRIWRVLMSPSVLWLYGLLIVGAGVVGALVRIPSD